MSSNRSFGGFKEYCNPSNIDWSVLENETSLLELHAALPPSFDFSKLSHLQTITNFGIRNRSGVITDEFVSFDLPFSVLNASIQYLEMTRLVVSESVWDDVTVGLPYLSYLGCTSCNWTLNTAPSENTINLNMSVDTILIRNPLGAGQTARYLFDSPRLSSIRLYNFPPTASLVLGNLPSLSELTIDKVFSLPEGLDTMQSVSVEKLMLKLPTNHTWLASIPPFLENQTSMRDVVLEGPFDNVTLESTLCSIHPTLTSLDIALSDPSPSSITWPNCTVNLTALTTLTVRAHRQFNWGDLVSKLPLSLTTAQFVNVFDISSNSALDFSRLYAFPNLTVLQISENGFTGQIPDNFLTNFTKIKSLNLSGNALSGKVPNKVSTLETMILRNNSFTAWDNIIGQADYLRLVDLSNNLLSSIPNDNSLLSIRLLRHLSISNNPTLSGTLPSFWATHRYMIYFNASGCSFSGPIQYPQGPSIMQRLDLSNNALVGSLPSTPIAVMDLSGNHLSGSIPMSWVDVRYPIISLNLKGNDLSGTVPNDLFMARTLMRASLIDLSDSGLHGPLFKMPTLRSKVVLNLQNTAFEFCLADPRLPSLSIYPRATPMCNLPPNAHCNCQQFYESCQLSNATCTIPCIPPPGYRCGSNNVYIFDGNVTEPSFPVPQGDIVVGGSINPGTTIVFEGAGTTLTVYGCIDIAEIEVVFDTVKSTESKVVINQLGSNCTSSLAELKVIVKTKHSSCKKVRVDTSGSTRSTLSVAFKIDGGGCNTKWIILGSVLGGVLIIGIVIVVLLVTFNPKVRDFFLPYDGANS